MKPRSRREIPAVNKLLDALGEYDLATANLEIDSVERLNGAECFRDAPEL